MWTAMTRVRFLKARKELMTLRMAEAKETNKGMAYDSAKAEWEYCADTIANLEAWIAQQPQE